MDIGKVKYWKHSSNTNFVLINQKESPLISIDLWCKAGISFEEDGKEGIAHFLEHMLFKGSDKLIPGEFDLKIESLGGSSNASTGFDDVHYYILIPRERIKESLNLLINLVFKPKFDINEFNLEKEVVIEEILQCHDQPDDLLNNIFLNRIWGNHPYGKSILGKEKSIKLFTVEDIIEFHESHYIEKNICIAIAGNLPEDIYEILNDCQIKYKKNNLINKNIKLKPKIRKGVEKISFDKIQFSRIFNAWRIETKRDQRILLGYEILVSILADGRNSKLVRPLKEENNLVESTIAYINSGEFGNLLIIETCCISENIDLVNTMIKEIINDILNPKDNFEKEILRAIRIIKSNYFFNLETSSQLTSYFGNHLLWGRINPHLELNEDLNYWKISNNFKDILKCFKEENFTFIVKKNK